MKKKYEILLVLVYLVVMTHLMSNLIDKDPIDYESNNATIIMDDIGELKSSGFWEEVAAITIDDDATGVDAHNWTWAIGESWCSGTGVYGDPFLIENTSVTIDAAGYGISIINSNATTYFRINNVTVVNIHASGAGIIINNTYNGEILDSICNSLAGSGIMAITSDNMTITGNTLNLNAYGLYMDNVTISTVATNDIINNTNTGLHMVNSTHNTIGNTNNLTDNDDYGIYMIDSDDNDINQNIIDSGNETGIAIVDCDNGTVYYNTISNNGDYGILIIEDNGDSLNNTIYRNDFDDNGVNGNDSCAIENNWDNGALGNDWDDYKSQDTENNLDADDDGIGDLPYDVPGSVGAEDNFPIYDDGDEPTPSFDDDDEDDSAASRADGMLDMNEQDAVLLDNVLIIVIAAVAASGTIFLAWYIFRKKKIGFSHLKKIR